MVASVAMPLFDRRKGMAMLARVPDGPAKSRFQVVAHGPRGLAVRIIASMIRVIATSFR